MPEAVVITRAGQRLVVPFTPGTSLMQAITEGGVDEVLALCGGVCACATCHVHVDPAHVGRLGPVSEDEDGLLSGSQHRRDQSRLSCQIRLTAEMDGLQVTVAPEDA